MLVQKADLQEMKTKFAQLDKDKDGHVSLKEFYDGIEHGEGHSREWCYSVIKRFDIEGDGQFDFNEFIEAATNH